jgi:hypothetical protein
MPGEICKGILVRDGPIGGAAFNFIGADGATSTERFNIPIRCRQPPVEGSVLCPKCQKRKEVTALAKKTPTSIEGGRTQYLNGVVGEPIPYWSHVVGSTWYLEKLAAGFRLSAEAEAKIRAAQERVYKGEAQPPPQPYPEEPRAPRRAKKKDDRVQTTLDLSGGTETALAPPPSSFAAAAAGPSPPQQITMAFYDSKRVPLEVADIIRVPVSKHVIDGMSVSVDTQKGKVYDLKARYLGRWDAAKNKIVAYPDSDAEA